MGLNLALGVIFTYNIRYWSTAEGSQLWLSATLADRASARAKQSDSHRDRQNGRLTFFTNVPVDRSVTYSSTEVYSRRTASWNAAVNRVNLRKGTTPPQPVWTNELQQQDRWSCDQNWVNQLEARRLRDAASTAKRPCLQFSILATRCRHLAISDWRLSIDTQEECAVMYGFGS